MEVVCRWTLHYIFGVFVAATSVLANLDTDVELAALGYNGFLGVDYIPAKGDPLVAVCPQHRLPNLWNTVSTPNIEPRPTTPNNYPS